MTIEDLTSSLSKLTVGNEENRGTGAGGSGTNETGLTFERKTQLGDIPGYILKSKKNFKKEMETKGVYDANIIRGHGCKEPDSAYINHEHKIVVIIEKKTQKGGGSICEKVQTAVFKLGNYKKQFPTYHVEYVFVLANWYKNNIPAELLYLKDENIPVFWGDEEEWDTKILVFFSALIQSSKL